MWLWLKKLFYRRELRRGQPLPVAAPWGRFVEVDLVSFVGRRIGAFVHLYARTCSDYEIVIATDQHVEHHMMKTVRADLGKGGAILRALGTVGFDCETQREIPWALGIEDIRIDGRSIFVGGALAVADMAEGFAWVPRWWWVPA